MGQGRGGGGEVIDPFYWPTCPFAFYSLVTPLVHLQIIRHPQRFCCLGLLLLHFRCPKPVQISGLGTGAWFSCVEHSWQTADWETNIHFGLSRSWNKWSWSEMPYYFICFVAGFFTAQYVVYFYIQNLSWNYNIEWSVQIRHVQFGTRVGKCVTPQCG